jgi:hypothetical protein
MDFQFLCIHFVLHIFPLAVTITAYDVDSRAVLTGATYTLNGQAFGSSIRGSIPLASLIEVSLSKPGYVTESRKVIVTNDDGNGKQAINFYLFPELVYFHCSNSNSLSFYILLHTIQLVVVFHLF